MSRPGETFWTPERLSVIRAVYAETGSHVRGVAALASMGVATTPDAVARALYRHGKAEPATGRPPRHEERETETTPSTERSVRFTEPPPMPRAAFVEPKRTGVRKAIVAHDIHVPMHSAVWFDLFKQVAVGAGVDTIILNGDVLDAEALGSYGTRIGETAKFSDEIDAGNDFFDDVDALGIVNRWICWGNHDGGRFSRYVNDRAPALHGLKGVSLEEQLRLNERGWQTIPYKEHLYFGSCLLTHELGKGGRNAARRTAEDIHHDASIGHTHRFSSEWRADVMGKPFFGATFGWGADWRAAHYTHSAHVAATHILGFGLLTWDLETGQTYPEPIAIVDGRCVAHGKVYVSRVAPPKVERRAA